MILARRTRGSADVALLRPMMVVDAVISREVCCCSSGPCSPASVEERDTWPDSSCCPCCCTALTSSTTSGVGCSMITTGFGLTSSSSSRSSSVLTTASFCSAKSTCPLLLPTLAVSSSLPTSTPLPLPASCCERKSTLSNFTSGTAGTHSRLSFFLSPSVPLLLLLFVPLRFLSRGSEELFRSCLDAGTE